MIDGLIIFYFVFGFFTLVLLTAGITMWILWRRRKLIFCNFLTESGQWERQSYKKQEINKTLTYDKEVYEYDIRFCTRDSLNRPIAHYYKGNPKQQLFDFTKGNKQVTIDTKDITGKDFLVLMTSKVLRDIFQDEEVMNMLYIIMIIVGVGFIITWILTFAYNPPVTLDVKDNSTMNFISQACRQAITKGK